MSDNVSFLTKRERAAHEWNKHLNGIESHVRSVKVGWDKCLIEVFPALDAFKRLDALLKREGIQLDSFSEVGMERAREIVNEVVK